MKTYESAEGPTKSANYWDDYVTTNTILCIWSNQEEYLIATDSLLQTNVRAYLLDGLLHQEEDGELIFKVKPKFPLWYHRAIDAYQVAS